jgi:hypothetical protein
MIVALDLTKRVVEVKRQITDHRNIALEAGFEYTDGLVYPCDTVFQEAVKTYLTAYVLAMKTPESTVRIRRYDNSFWYPDYSELVPFAGALMLHVEKIWTDYWQEKDSITAGV